MGGEDPEARVGEGEGPVRPVATDPFLIDRTTVTNSEFAAFVMDSGYVTEAEQFGWSFVFQLALGSVWPRSARSGSAPGTPWWIGVSGASWHRPEGPGSSIAGREDHPVVHVSWNDASSFAAWAEKRLPTEAEWEKSARGGREQTRFPWGDELTAGGEHQCNLWQGEFPFRNDCADGYRATAPADAFAPNGYGLHNVIGNVWEWCADWWSPDWHAPDRTDTRTNPRGPLTGDAKVMRGGSYLCNASYCNRYRLPARTRGMLQMTAAHLGFRCAKELAD